MLRSLKLVINFALTACVFTFFLLLLIGLLNPAVAIGKAGLLPVFLDLLTFYGPLWFVFIALTFFVVQFFSERKYPIGFFNPPTLVYFFSFTMLVVSVLIYANYDYYHDLFQAAARDKFIKILLLNFLLLILGLVFVFSKTRRKKWLQALFLLLLAADCLAAYALVVQRIAPLPTAFRYTAPAIDPPRQINIVVMEGLSLNYLLGGSQEQSLLNLNWIKENGVIGRLKTQKPNMDLSLFNTLLTGEVPAAASAHSVFKFQFRDLPLEFDIFPKYIFFRNSAKLDVIDFYKKPGALPTDRIKEFFARNGFKTFTMITPPAWPIYAEKNLKKNNTFVQFFSAMLNSKDKKMDIVKKIVLLRRFHPQADTGIEDQRFSLFPGPAHRPGERERPFLPLRASGKFRQPHRCREQPEIRLDTRKIL